MERSSLTPCLDENRIDEGAGGDNSKEIELSDISDDEEWPQSQEVQKSRNTNGNGKSVNQYGFKKITRSNRDRNYRDKRDEKEFNEKSSRNRKTDINRRKKEIQRYDVRKVIASKDFSISRSKSRSVSPKPATSRYRKSFSPRKRSKSPISRPNPSKTHRYSPNSPRHHSPTPDFYRNYQQQRSPLPEEMFINERKSRHKHSKLSELLKN